MSAKIIAFILLFFCVNLSAFAADSQPDLLQQVKFNYTVLYANSDASMFLHSLDQLESGNIKDVQNFMEYRLDEFVCLSWKNKEKMNTAQEGWLMETLHRIKTHREKSPRATDVAVDPQEYYKYLEAQNTSYAQCADEILASLK